MSGASDPRARLANLTPAQRDLLLRRLAQAGGQAPARPAELVRIARGPGEAPPLSFAQERAWFLDRLTPMNPAHVLAGALRLEGELSLPALAATLGAVVGRHEPLRATFGEAAGEPAQTVREPAPFALPLVDLSRLAEPVRTARGRRLFLAETRRGFDLTRDLLLRPTLVRLGESEHLLLLALHRIAADGASIGVVMREIAVLYPELAAGRPPHLPPLAVRYGDFAAWQRRRLEGAALDRGLAFWRQELAAPPAVVELEPDALPGADDGDDAPAAGRDLAGATAALTLGRELKQRLDALGRAHDTTLFVTMLAAFLTVLLRTTGRDDLVVGAPVSGRPRLETEPLVGLFVNTLALRARLAPELAWSDALAAVRRSVLAALEHAEVPFERVVQEVGAEREAARHPLFETVFNFTPGQTRTLELGALRASFEEPPEMGAKFALELFVGEWQGALELELLYPRERYSARRMEILLEQLQAVLEQAVQDPERRLGAFDLTTPGALDLLPDPSLVLAAPAQTPVPRTIAEWVAKTPDAPALCQGELTVTYAELGARMAAIAEALHGRGLAPGEVAAVTGLKAPGVVVAMAGVLLAGGVLLTLSPELPVERRRLMLRTAGARVLLYIGERSAEDGWLGDEEGIEIVAVALDGTVDAPAARPLARFLAEAPGVPAESPPPSAPAYVFFTSGSTGAPKGVLGTHAGLAHFLAWQRETFAVGPADRAAHLTGLSFDVVLRDVFLALTAGGALTLPPPTEPVAGPGTVRFLEEAGVTLVHTVPAVLDSWLLQPPPGVELKALRCLFLAGEPLTATLVRRWRRAFPRAGEVVNLYGPTETTLAKCCYRVPAQPRPGVQPLGVPLPQSQALVLTAERRLAGVGEPGEIAVRTPFRTRGFLGAPEETARRFVANPWRDDPEDLLYLTGDRGVLGADGLLEFRGRLDHQVKVRGVRVEPSEVSAALRTAPGVAACAVVAREDGPAGAALVAYVVPAPGAGEEPDRLQEHLRRRLPAAMVPSAYVFLDALPLTANQKLDRQRLPPPSGFRPLLKSPYRAPSDAVELRLVQVWEELLKVRPIGVDDSFFELGGHSLLALQLLMKIGQALGRKLTLGALFESPTIAHLAGVIRRQESTPERLVPLWSAAGGRRLFLVHPGGGVLWNYVPLVRHLAAPVPVVGIQAQGLAGEGPPHRDVAAMAAAYLAEVRALQSDGPYLLAGHSLGGLVAFEMARQLHEAGEEVALLALFDAALVRADEAAPEADERAQDARALADMAATVERFLGREVGVSYETLRLLAPDAQVAAVVAALEASGAPHFAGGGVELVRRLLEVGKAHVAAGRAYRARAAELRSPVPITLFRAQGAAAADGDETLGWAAVSTAPVRLAFTPGDHVTMMSEPHVEELARELRARLESALAAGEAAAP